MPTSLETYLKFRTRPMTGRLLYVPGTNYNDLCFARVKLRDILWHPVVEITSAALKWTRHVEISVAYGQIHLQVIGVTKERKRHVGSNTDHWRIPNLTAAKTGLVVTETKNILFDRYEEKHFKAVPHIPVQRLGLSNSRQWLAVTKRV